MQILILSDSHTMNKHDLLTLLGKHEVAYYFHCGDIYLTYEDLLLDNFYLVQGNNDFSKEIPSFLSVTIDNKHFFITHGHKYDVDISVDELIFEAKKHQANVICYGHTHRPYKAIIDNILVINPGSVIYPRGSYRNPTYCILDTSTLKVTFYDITTNLPCDPFIKTDKSFSRKKWLKKFF